jgi:hypothetical protein
MRDGRIEDSEAVKLTANKKKDKPRSLSFFINISDEIYQLPFGGIVVMKSSYLETLTKRDNKKKARLEFYSIYTYYTYG